MRTLYLAEYLLYVMRPLTDIWKFYDGFLPLGLQVWELLAVLEGVVAGEVYTFRGRCFCMQDGNKSAAKTILVRRRINMLEGEVNKGRKEE